jgi:hypothetical protein
MGAESANSSDTTTLAEIGSITNAVILTEPNNPYIQSWYSQIADNLEGKAWAFHAVCLPKIILDAGQHDVTIQPKKVFMPFCFRDPFIFVDESKDYMLNESCTIHLWETIWKHNYLNGLNVEYFNSCNSLFVKYFGKYIDVLHKNMGKIIDILDNCYSIKQYNKLYDYSNMYIQLCKRYTMDIDVKVIAYNSIAIGSM